MRHFLEKIHTIDPTLCAEKKLGEWLNKQDFSNLHYTSFLPDELSSKSYIRTPLLESPVECLLLFWPPGIESAVHLHKGFYGYVVVLEGIMENIHYSFEGKTLHEKAPAFFTAGSICHEPDGTIHKICNASESQALISLHIYAPPNPSVEDVIIYDTALLRRGVLGPEAESASWSEPLDHFKVVEESAFEFHPFVAAYTPVNS